jgi:hypothetical protein
MVEAMSQQAQEVAQTDMGDGVTLEQAMGGLGAAIEIGAQMAMLDGMDPADPDQARMMADALAELHAKIAENRASLGDQAAADMEAALVRHEQRLTGTRAAAMPASQAKEPVLELELGRAMAPPTLSLRAPLTNGIARNGDAGFAVPVSPQCPPGTQLRGASPPEGSREWCDKVGRDAGIKHGWMTAYHETGARAAAGEYRDGLRIGVWSRYYEDGSLRVQAEFEDGLQHGVLLSWNRDGSLATEKHFSQGAPASR